MNNVCLCVGNYAKKPYYVKLSDVNLYSIEELCYYFYDKVRIIDDSIITDELVKWIRTECGLDELANELEIYVRKKVSVAAFVTTILQKTGMYDDKTIRQIEVILKEQSSLTMLERYKKQAEYFYRQGRFRQALVIYAELAEHIPMENRAARALMYYNMASLYALDFAYGLAADYYYKAYCINPDDRIRLAYIIASKKSMTDYAYGGFKRENPDWEADFRRAEEMCEEADRKWQTSNEREILTQLDECKAGGDTENYRRQAKSLISQLKQDYKRQTQL